MSLLKIEGLSKNFGGLAAVKNLDFEVQQGETMGLIGPNGSGKTTTLNLLTGFQKPTSGKITFKEIDITDLPRPAVCKQGIARTFQIVKPFLEFTALQNVMVGRVYGHEPARSMKIATEESKDCLDRVGLLDRAETHAKDLTLMQRKRLELARAIATRPQLLLLDELMAGLNHAETEDAMSLIRQIKEELNLTLIVVEHIVKAILGLSDRVLVMNMGEKITIGLPQQVIHDPEVVDVYLGKPHAES
ncbi:MAG: ABC transporter ATP-binding protein [Anaerolineales bacterium]